MGAPEATAAALGVELGETVLGLVALYGIMSFNEYIYHRYFQHLGINKLDLARDVRNELNLGTYRGDGHVEHHRETLDDMTLDARPHPELDADPFRGTAFPWWATCVMTLSVMTPAYPILSAIGWSGPVIVGTILVVMFLHATVWNSLHPHMHGLPDVTVSHGVPSLLTDYRDSALFSWLRKNHEGHHRAEGAHGNYNVCCPGMDQLVGTYVGEIPPQEVAASA